MSESRPRATRDEVEEAIRQVRAYYQQGRASLRELPERGRYGQKAIAEAAERLGWTDTKLRKARQFALLFTREQLHDLCGLVRRHLSHFGPTHVGIAVTVPKARERASLLRACIEEDWSKVELEAEIKKRFGPRRFGGRRRRVADDPLQALVQVDEMADSWLRWHAVASEEPPGNGHTESVLDRLPEPVRGEVRKVTGAMRRLRDAAAGELEQARARTPR